MDRDLFLAEAERLIGVPFKFGGRSEHAVDCAGLLIVCAQAAGYQGPFPPHCSVLKAQSEILSALHAMMDPTDRGSLDLGDILTLRYGRNLQHLAIVTDNAMMIHAFQGGRKVVKTGIDHARIGAAFRPRWSKQ